MYSPAELLQRLKSDQCFNKSEDGTNLIRDEVHAALTHK